MSFSITVEGQKDSGNERTTVSKRKQVALPLEVGNAIKSSISELLLEGYTLNSVNVYAQSHDGPTLNF